MTKLQGAHVIITGGSQGIGAASAKEAHDAGARVSLIARGSEGLGQATAAAGPGVRWRAAVRHVLPVGPVPVGRRVRSRSARMSLHARRAATYAVTFGR